MDAARWTQIKELFAAALEQPPARRAGFLDQACGDDGDLRREVEELLRSHEATSGLFDRAADTVAPFWAAPPTALPPGTRFGPYRLLREIGHGGMGFVYLAERADGLFQQQVALKIVPREAATGEAVQRFHFERQILARLEHPHIARLLDGGTAADGQPYLVMEYVEGLPLTAYCDQHRLDPEARLHLFLQAVAAVHYAHQNLVVHRDLKPSNILVTEGGGPDDGPTVKLLDFGIAKLLGEEADRDGMDIPQTRTGMRLLTPEYAAPEQVRGEPVTTAADVYALGVLLYELLAGCRPYEVAGLAPGEVERVVCELEPLRPSTALMRLPVESDGEGRTLEGVSRARGLGGAAGAERLRRRLAGDLDVIVLKALRKEPERRYASAEAFADDVRRHLAGLPVAARPDTLAYRASRFVRRHRVGVATAAAFLLLLVGGFVITLWQAQVARRERARAEQRFANVRHLANTLLFDLHDAIAELPGSTPARHLLVERSLAYLDTLAREAAGDRSLLLELAAAYRKVGDVQGNPTNANLGQMQGALASYQKAVALTSALLAADSSADARLAQALVLERLADVQAATGAFDAADSSLQAAVGHYAALARAVPSSAEAQTRYAVGLIKRGDLAGNPNFSNRGRPEDALDHYLAARPLLAGVLARDSTQARARRLLGLVYERIGTMQDLGGTPRAAIAAYRTSMEIREAVAAAQPSNVEAVRDLAIAHEKMGDVAVKLGELREAQRRYARATAIFEDLWRRDPDNVQAQQSLAISHLHLGDVAGLPGQPNLGDRAAARRHYRQALALLQELARLDSTNARAVFLLGYTRDRLVQVGR